MQVVVGAKDAMVEIREIATEYFTIGVPTLRKSGLTSKDEFLEEKRRTIAAVRVKWVEALKALLQGVVLAAAHAESSDAAAAIAKSAARHALAPNDPPERARFLGTVFEATFDLPKPHELVAETFQAYFAAAVDFTGNTDQTRALLDFARLAAFKVIAADVAKHAVDSAAAARSPEAAAAFAKDVVTPVVKQFPHVSLFAFMDAALDKAEAAVIAENRSGPLELYASYSTKIARETLLELAQERRQEFARLIQEAEAAPADSASRDVAPT